MELRDRIALVTGAAGGIGPQIARALVAEGARVCLSDLPAAAERLEEVRVQTGAALAHTADVTAPEGREALVGAIEEQVGPLDVLVNNAGIENSLPFEEFPPGEISAHLAVNLEAPMLLTRRVLPGMLERGRGHVVNIASMAGKVGTPYLAPYSASKFGLVGFTEALRAELRDRPVSASVICPIFVTDAGMYERKARETGVTAPRPLTTNTDAVASAVVRAISRDRPEILCVRAPSRPMLALKAIAPRLAERVQGRAAAAEEMEQVARQRARELHGGS